MSSVLTECRSEYAIGTLIFIVRWATRGKMRTWKLDDWFSISAWMFFTLLYSMVEYLSVVGAPIAFSQAEREALPTAMKISMREGAKAMFASFFFLICLVWSLKACLIVFFLNLTKNTPLRNYIRVLAGISVVCFMAAIITEFTHCLPLHRNWQILPDPGKECSAGITTNIMVAVGNVLVDGLLLVVPTLMLKDARITVWRKIRIGFLLSLGIFVMGMAIARCYLSIGNTAQTSQSSVWAQREALVSTFAVNAPIINALFKPETWRSKSGTGTGQSKGAYSEHSHFDRNNSGKGLEIYKMTDIERSSKESTAELVSGGPVPSQWNINNGAAKGHGGMV
ncbi:hypothetical protein P280DRAFT_543151 [Massarina eburnea CBS 473.64]|uniref:Rhodopsin domain-containing protein n=1 Tax=Massarina eburnea CBS 473.64 TaxID=1395130 RepID=A0A6A6RYN6_9PLEO|nr:hypothetical protein P280DRAFT_543151 [Massarina eburnea CBS 473.64]